MKNVTQGLFLALALLGCGGTEEAPPVPPPPGTAPPTTPPPPPAGPTELVVGGPAVTINSPASPGLAFTVATAAEYQIDVMGTDVDPLVYLFMGGNYLTMDDDHGDGLNSRLVAFLAPGSYEARPADLRRGAYAASVTLTLLTPMTPAGAITPGAPGVVVAAPAGEYDRAASGEVTLTIATAGNYTIDAVGPGTNCDAQLLVHQNGAEVGHDSDSGDENNARLTQALTPGAYNIRVFDWVHRACAITVSAAAAP